MSVVVAQLTARDKARAFAELMKMRLASLVIFSSAMTFILASQQGSINWVSLVLFSLGGLLVTGAANTINQIIEIDRDRLMRRTANRPLPTGRIAVSEARLFAMVTGGAGTLLVLGATNALTAALTFASLLLYAFVYTPMKPRTPLAVMVGAVPGALPPLLGFTAVTGQITVEGLILFGIQFIWQFPHFWAIAWVLDDDYRKAGFRLLPSGGGKNLNTAFQIMIYTLCLIPLGLLPLQFGMTGTTSAVIATVCGCLFLMQTFSLMRNCTEKEARKIMFGSFLYLPIVQIAFVLDKI